MERRLWIKPCMVAALLFALALLRDYDPSSSSKQGGHGFSVVTALRRHPPSLRVFRALSEVTLILICSAISIFVWTRAAGKKVVGVLLFQIPNKIANNSNTAGLYQPVSVEEDLEDYVVNEGLEEGDDSQIGKLEIESDRGGDDNNEDEAPEPPSAASVLQAALDLLLFVLVSLFLFTLSSAEGGRYIEGIKNLTVTQTLARFAAPVFPLILFIGASVWSLVPFTRRRIFWTILSFTTQAPFHDVTFRDGFIGDVLTSSVRPLQDLAFTLFYVCSGLSGWWTRDYTLDEAAMPVERNWILRTVVLPACMISPLWWRFMQNLRQSYDAKKRWPYLGNALKYLAAAQVAMFGVFDPRRNGSPLWLACFVLSTLYQVWWDIFMDWELVSIRNGSINLRRQRLYSSRFLYLAICVINLILRFGWTLSFLPNRYLDKAGTLRRTFKGGLSGIIEPILASAEIFRRMLWGFLRFELEAIKSCSDDPFVAKHIAGSNVTDDNEGVEMMPLGDSLSASKPSPTIPLTLSSVQIANDLSDRTNVQILFELCTWATLFAAGGVLAAAHRGTF